MTDREASGELSAIRRAPRLLAGERIYAIGDVHGRLDLLAELIAIIRNDDEAWPAGRVRILLLGDIVDRGENGAKLVTLCMEFTQRSGNFVVLKGNHEAMMVAAYRGNLAAMRVWLRSGGAATLHSWGVDPEIIDEGEPAALLAAMRRSIPKSTIAWLNALPTSYETGDYFFVHAGVRPGIALHRQRTEDLLWIKEEFTEDVNDHSKMIVHGHSERNGEAERLPNRIGIDTGAYRTDILTALGIQDEISWTLQTRGQQEISIVGRTAGSASCDEATLRDDLEAILGREVPLGTTSAKAVIGRQRRATTGALLAGILSVTSVALILVLTVGRVHDRPQQIADLLPPPVSRVERATVESPARPIVDKRQTAAFEATIGEQGEHNYVLSPDTRPALGSTISPAHARDELDRRVTRTDNRTAAVERTYEGKKALITVDPSGADEGPSESIDHSAAIRMAAAEKAAPHPDAGEDRAPSSDRAMTNDVMLASLSRDRNDAGLRRREALDLIRSLRRQ